MAFQKGQPKHPNAGRKKGVPNKKKVAKVADLLAEQEVNPVQEILDLINGTDDDGKPLLWPSDKLSAWFDLLSYCQAKPKEDPNLDDGNEDQEDALDPLTTPQLLKLIKNSEVT